MRLGAHLEGRGGGAGGNAEAQQLDAEAGAVALAFVVRVDGNGRDVELVEHAQRAGMSDDMVVVARDEVRAVVGGEFGAPLGRRPRPAVAPGVDRTDGVDVAPRHRFEDDTHELAVSHLATASGRRR